MKYSINDLIIMKIIFNFFFFFFFFYFYNGKKIVYDVFLLTDIPSVEDTDSISEDEV